MQKNIFLLTAILLLCLSTASLAQEQNKSLYSLQTIGKGEIKVAPDWTVLYMELTSKSMNFNTAVQDINKKATELEKELTTAGFTKTDLKTTGYTVTKNIVYTTGVAIDSGYIARQNFLLEFPNEQARIIKTVKTLSESRVGTSFNFSFTLSPQKREQAESDILKRAIADAKQKGKVLSEAAGVSLKKILSIEYGKMNYPPQPYAMTAMAKEGQAGNADFGGFTVNDLDLSDQVTITWEIAQP